MYYCYYYYYKSWILLDEGLSSLDRRLKKIQTYLNIKNDSSSSSAGF